MEETQCKWVSSRGLLKSCDRRNNHPQSSCRHIDEDILHNVKDYDVIHICSWLTIASFVKNFVLSLKKKIDLI